MPVQHISQSSLIRADGNKLKEIREYIGRVSTGSSTVSVAHMISPQGWAEPGQRPEFDEYTVVLSGALYIRTEDDGLVRVGAGEAVIAPRGEWVQYSTPEAEGAQYIAVCLPAFSQEAVHRDA